MVRIFFLILLFTSNAFAQDIFSISGTIKDKSGTLEGASVYLSGYKLSTATNKEGKFTLPNLKPGNYDILVQMIGFQPLSKNVLITDKSVSVELKLMESTTQLNEVVIKPNPNREYLINLFKDFFIGKTPNATQCKILNVNSIIVNEDKQNRSFTVDAPEFLIIENEALGYKIKYLLENFEYSFATRMLFFGGYPTFEEMIGNKSKQKKWIKNREIAYRGSAQHFFTSLYTNKIDEEGFIVNRRYEMPNADRLPDSLIEANIKQIIGGKGASLLTVSNKNGNSLNYWMQEKRKPKIFHVVDRNKINIDTLVKTINSTFKAINYKDELFVTYKKEKEAPDYDKTPYYVSRPMDLTGQVSVIKMLRAPIYFYSNGIIYNPRSTLNSGYWAFEKMADMVPMDYLPPISK